MTITRSPEPPTRDRDLSAQEEEILASDRTQAPKVVALLVRIDGRLDPRQLRTAIDAAAQRHRMARARLVVGAGRAPRWSFLAGPGRGTGADLLSCVGCADEEEMREVFAALCARPMNLAVTAPVRFLLARLPTCDALAVVAHHVAMDGTGALQLTRAIVEAYGGTARLGTSTPSDNAPDPVPVPIPDGGPVDPAPDHDHALVAALPDGTVAETLASAWHRPPTRIAPAAAGLTSGPGRGYLVVQTELPPAAPDDPSPGPGDAATRAPADRPAGGDPWAAATTNDVLVAALHATVARWNGEQGRPSRQIRIRIPVNKRPRAARLDGVGNANRQAIVLSSPADRVNPRRLLTSVVDQTSRIKDTDSMAKGPAAVVGPRGVLAVLPARVRMWVVRAGIGLSRHWLMPTTTLSKLSRVTEPWTFGTDGPTVTSLFFATFAGPPQGLAVGVAGYGGRTWLNFGCSRALFERPAAERFAALFIEEMNALRRAPRSPAGRG